MLLQRPDEDALLPLFLFPRHLNHYSQITILSSSPPSPSLAKCLPIACGLTNVLFLLRGPRGGSP